VKYQPSDGQIVLQVAMVAVKWPLLNFGK